MDPVLPLEILEVIIEEACLEHTNRRQLSTTFSSLALVCTFFRHCVNRIRFRNISFSFKSSVFPRPGIRMTQFGDLLNADKSVCSRRGGSNSIAKNTIAYHITEFSVDITAGNGYVLHLLGDGVLAKIMRKLFRGLPAGQSSSTIPHDGYRDSCKFSLAFNVLRIGGVLTLLDWTTLEQDFVEAFRYMCTKSRLSSLSLKGCSRFPTQLVCESNIRRLFIESVAFEHESVPMMPRQPQYLDDLAMDGLRFPMPDDNMIIQVRSLVARLWEARELERLLDIVESIPKLEKLRICLEPKEIPEEFQTFDHDLPYLKTLIIDFDLRNISSKRNTTLPFMFILGPHTPPSVQYIEVGFAIYIYDLPREALFITYLHDSLSQCNLPLLDTALTTEGRDISSLEHVFFRFSVKHSSFVEMDPFRKAGLERDARNIVFSFLPLLSASERVKLEIAVSVDGNQDAWRRQRRNYGS